MIVRVRILHHLKSLLIALMSHAKKKKLLICLISTWPERRWVRKTTSYWTGESKLIGTSNCSSSIVTVNSPAGHMSSSDDDALFSLTFKLLFDDRSKANKPREEEKICIQKKSEILLATNSHNDWQSNSAHGNWIKRNKESWLSVWGNGSSVDVSPSGSSECIASITMRSNRL